MSKVNTKTGRKAPVVLASGMPRRRRRERGETFDAQALAAPVPGPLLVLLSRLHRQEETGPDDVPVSDASRLSSGDADL